MTGTRTATVDSQFRRHYRAHWKLDAEPRMRRTLLPAQLCEVDYAGMTMTVIAANGERPVSIFVGTLPFSTYIYAEATWTQSAEDWLGSHVRMFGAWGGSVPKLVPDNLKTGVTHASFYDPALNRSYSGACAPLRHRRGPSARAPAEG